MPIYGDKNDITRGGVRRTRTNGPFSIRCTQKVWNWCHTKCFLCLITLIYTLYINKYRNCLPVLRELYSRILASGWALAVLSRYVKSLLKPRIGLRTHSVQPLIEILLAIRDEKEIIINYRSRDIMYPITKQMLLNYFRHQAPSSQYACGDVLYTSLWLRLEYLGC